MRIDLELAQRLEATEAAICATYTEPRRRVSGVMTAVLERGGAVAIFDGADSPLSQSFGLGLFEPAAPDQLAELEAFFQARGADAMHEVSPFAGVETLALLVARGYQPIELSTVLVQPLTDAAPIDGPLIARAIDPERDGAAWLETSVAGWASEPEVAAIARSIAEVGLANRGVTQYLVERDGAPIASGTLGVHGNVALLIGASTRPEARGLGAQAAILARRLADARARGCTTAMMVAAVGSASQRNAERRGFRVAYTRSKWRLGRAG